MSVAVEFSHVSKYFVLSQHRPRSFQEIAVNLFRKRSTARDELHILKDVSFQLEHGQTIGFIGANGAGKSTILKLISRIIEPSSGHIQVSGRIGALLELGAGFHPELTGRENIYLNASIMGLGREEIHRKLDAIISFAELEQFIDTPVKHYSSGMYVRLGFAVAVHTNPEILLVDEVLAVGDAAFQHKCMDRIAQMRRKGVTIVWVSHDLGTIQSLCHQAIWFDEGQIAAQGEATDVVMAYLNHVAEKEEARARFEAEQAAQEQGGSEAADNQAAQKDRWGTGRVRITDVTPCDVQGNPAITFRTGETLRIRLRYQTEGRVEAPVFGLAIHHQNGTHICGPNTHFGGLEIAEIAGTGEVVYTVPALPLLEGAYQVSVSAHNRADTEMFDYHDRLYSFRVYPGDTLERYGLVTLGGHWRLDAD